MLRIRYGIMLIIDNSVDNKMCCMRLLKIKIDKHCAFTNTQKNQFYMNARVFIIFCHRQYAFYSFICQKMPTMNCKIFLQPTNNIGFFFLLVSFVYTANRTLIFFLCCHTTLLPFYSYAFNLITNSFDKTTKQICIFYNGNIWLLFYSSFSNWPMAFSIRHSLNL